MTTPSKPNSTPSKQRRTPGSSQRTRRQLFFRSAKKLRTDLCLAAKRRNPLTALHGDEPMASPTASSILQMPFTPGRTPNKNRGYSF